MPQSSEKNRLPNLPMFGDFWAGMSLLMVGLLGKNGGIYPS